MPHPSLPLHKRVFRILKAAAAEFGEDMATRFGAALSFYTLFSLVPLLLLIAAVVGFVSEDSAFTPFPSGTQDSQALCNFAAADTPISEIAGPNPENPLDRLIVQVDEVAGPAISGQLADLTCQASAQRGPTLGIGVFLALFTGSSVFLHVQGILNFIFHAPETRTKGITNALVQRAIAVVWAILLAVLVFVPLVAVAGVNFIRSFVPDEIRPVLGVAVPLVSLALLIVVVAATFQLLTRVEVPWQAARRGGLFTAFAGLAGAFGVGFYLSNFGSNGALGAIGGAAILLFFFNLMWIIYLFGAEVTKVYADFLQHGDVMSPSQRTDTSERVRQLAASTPGGEKSVPAPMRSATTGFLVGLVTGWAARRRE